MKPWRTPRRGAKHHERSLFLARGTVSTTWYMSDIFDCWRTPILNAWKVENEFTRRQPSTRRCSHPAAPRMPTPEWPREKQALKTARSSPVLEVTRHVRRWQRSSSSRILRYLVCHCTHSSRHASFFPRKEANSETPCCRMKQNKTN